MTEKSAQTLRRIYGICLSALTVLIATLFIVQIWAIFRSTDGYTLEIISEKFSQIAIPFWLWIVAIVGGGVISFIFPETEEMPKAFVDVRITLTRLQARIPKDAESLLEASEKGNGRKIAWGIGVGVCLISTVVALAYLFNAGYVVKFSGEFFQTHAEAEKLIKIAPWVLASLCVCAGALIYQEYSLKKELAQVKGIFAEYAKNKALVQPQEKEESAWEKMSKRLSSPKLLTAVRAGLAIVGIALFVIGIFNGGMADVLAKAVNICTQCIGLG